MIKVKNYSNEQIDVIRNSTHRNVALHNMSLIASDVLLSKKDKTLEMLKQLLAYVAMRRNELLNANIKNRDVDYLIKQEIKDIKYVLEELNDAISKDN